MSTTPPSGQGDSIAAMAPSYDFRNNVDSARYTKAIYIAPSTGTSFEVANSFADSPDDSVTFYVGGQVIPVRTKSAVTITGYAVVYLY